MIGQMLQFKSEAVPICPQHGRALERRVPGGGGAHWEALQTLGMHLQRESTGLGLYFSILIPMRGVSFAPTTVYFATGP